MALERCSTRLGTHGVDTSFPITFEDETAATPLAPCDDLARRVPYDAVVARDEFANCMLTLNHGEGKSAAQLFCRGRGAADLQRELLMTRRGWCVCVCVCVCVGVPYVPGGTCTCLHVVEQ